MHTRARCAAQSMVRCVHITAANRPNYPLLMDLSGTCTGGLHGQGHPGAGGGAHARCCRGRQSLDVNSGRLLLDNSFVQF